MIRLKSSLLAAATADTSHSGRLAALKQTLQNAIELEHSTIPPYLQALYSIKTGANLEVAKLIRSVVTEEMLHLSLIHI